MSQNKTNKPGVESLLNTTSKKYIKWLPIPIDKYRSQMENGYFSGMQFHFKSNIAYSLQHLEFQLQHIHLHLHPFLLQYKHNKSYLNLFLHQK